MPRTVKEWRGKTDDHMPPQTVSLRIWERFKGRCAHCERKLMPGDKPARDHIVPLADGGENVESNFQLLCDPCHKAKTSAENSSRAVVNAKKASVLGLPKQIKRPLPGSRASGIRKRMNGAVERW